MIDWHVNLFNMIVTHELTSSSWSHMLPEKPWRFFSTATSLNRYPLDCMIELFTLTTRATFLSKWGTALLVDASPTYLELLHVVPHQASVFEAPRDSSDWQSPRDGASAIFESVGTLDIHALKEASIQTPLSSTNPELVLRYRWKCGMKSSGLLQRQCQCRQQLHSMLQIASNQWQRTR